MRCTLDRLMPVSAASLRTDHCVLPSCGFCWTFRQILACTAGVAVRGLLPLCCGSNPSIPDSSKRCFQREIVGAVVCRLDLIASYVIPSPNARISRARKTSPAGKVRECAQPVNSFRCSSVSETNSRYPATADRRIHPYVTNSISETLHSSLPAVYHAQPGELPLWQTTLNLR